MGSRLMGMALVILVLTSACGQKPGVNELAAAGELPAGATVDPATGDIIDSEGNVIGNTSDASEAISGGGAAVEDARAESSGSSGTEGPTGTAPAAEAGTDTSGVTSTRITIGGHAPLTGAAPIPSDSAQKGNDLYYKWLKHIEDPLNGRNVEAILKNDNYNPSQAVAVCKELVESDGAFLLYGYAGTDQIQACARYAASVGVPYLSAGVTEVGLTTLPNYFALSLSYAEQGSLLADFLTTKLNARSEANGMLRFDTPNFQDAHDSFVKAMGDRGAELAYDRGVSKNAGQAEAQAAVQEMKALGLENVYVLTSPLWFLQVLQAAKTQNYSPQWVGVGITKGLDTVASVGCRNGTLSGAKFFSPFPAWADIERFDPDFPKAVAAVYPQKEGGDDIMLIGWGMGKVIADLLDRSGRDLTRQGFIATAERAKNVKTDVFPAVSYAPDDHFGGSATHLNEAHCSGYKSGDNRWHTIMSNVSNF